MLAAPLVALALAGSVAASATPTTGLFRRAGASGCTCYGFGPSGTALLYSSSVNNVGWCFEDGSLRPEWVGYVTDGINSGIATDWVNAPAALGECQTAGVADADCANYIISTFTNYVLANSHESTSNLAKCTNVEMAPEDSIVQTSCQCDYYCINGYERCGDDGCMDPGMYVCVSGVITQNVQITRKRAAAALCPTGFEVCRGASGLGYECLDTQTNIEACGGCPNTLGSTDCTALASQGASAASCRAGQCVVESCSRSFRLMDGECKQKQKRAYF